MQKKNKKIYRKAFTLIELLVVIAIIGILSGLIIVSMSGVTQKANIAKAQVFSNSLKNSLMINLVSEWKFDLINSPNQNQTPDSWGGNNGTLGDTAACSFVSPYYCPQIVNSDCIYGKCLSFDGTGDSSDYVNTAYYFDNGAKSISAWIKPSSFTKDYRGIVSDWWYSTTNGGEQTNFGLNYDKLYAGVYSEDKGASVGIVSSLSLNLNTWYLVVFTYNSNGASKIYINGSEAGSGTLPVDIDNHKKTVLIGHFRASADASLSRPFAGLIDEVRIYNAAISSSQIKEQYYAGLNSLLANGNIAKEEYRRRINSIASNE